MTSFADTRVDICLYFIAPHALLPADIATIKRLGSMVPIVPIIAKVPSLATLLHAATGCAADAVNNLHQAWYYASCSQMAWDTSHGWEAYRQA